MTKKETREYLASLMIELDELHAVLATIADQGDDEGDMDPDDTYLAMCRTYTPAQRTQLLQAAGLAWSRLSDFIGALQQASHGDPRPEPL